MRTNQVAKVILAATVLLALPSEAGLKKWLQKEVIPTIKGERPLEIKPYVSVKHDNKVEFRVGPNDFKIKVGDVTIQTHQLRLRLMQAGCVVATSGDVLTCAPDIVERELLNIADRINPSDPATISGSMPPYIIPAMPIAAPLFQSGTPMQQCGCWGYNPPTVAFEPRCSFSRVLVSACPGVCGGGGMPYGYVCM